MTDKPTDEEIDAVTLEVLGYAALDKNTNETARLIARAVLAKWGQPAQAGEPVAYVEVSQSDSEVSMTRGPEPAGFGLPSGRHTLFTTPQPTQTQAGGVNPWTKEQNVST